MLMLMVVVMLILMVVVILMLMLMVMMLVPHDGVGADRGHSHQVARGENQKHSLLVLSFKSLKPYQLPLLSVQKEEFV